MITIDITVIIQIINILLLIVVMNAVLYRPVRTALTKRKEKIDELATAIETFKKNAELRKEEISRKLNDARTKAKDEIDKAKGAAQASTAESLAQVRQEATDSKNTQLTEIKKQFTEAQQQLSGQKETFASEMAAKILGRSI